MKNHITVKGITFEEIHKTVLLHLVLTISVQWKPMVGTYGLSLVNIARDFGVTK
jgi:hypothetical protein